MKRAFITTLAELARKDKRIFFLTGDLGFSAFENFREEFPDRFFNVGLAEQNMVGIASGLALSGKIPFIYSIIPFLIMRPFEQIRDDICYQNCNVKLVGGGGGFGYGSAGSTHHAIEDIAIMRAIPNMTIVCPADPQEVELATMSAFVHQGPVYMRLGQQRNKISFKDSNFKLNKGRIVREGGDITIISTGDILENVLNAAEKLSEEKIEARVINMHTVKPIDKEIIIESANKTKKIFVVEEHTIIGGLGSAVAEVLMSSSFRNFNEIVFKSIGIQDAFTKVVGEQNYLREKYNLSADAIFKQIKEKL